MTEPVTYTPPKPTTQAGVAGVATAAAVILAWGLKEFAGVAMPAEITAAMSVLIGWFAGKWGT
jgi:hypothetical protein